MFFKLIFSENQQFTTIYSSTYEKRIDSDDTFQQISSIKVASKTGLIFTSHEESGLIIVNSNQNNEVVFKQKINERVENAFAVTSDGEYIFLCSQLRFYAYYLDTKTSSIYTMKQYYTVETDESITQDMVFLKSEQRLLIAHFSGKIILLDISQRKNKIIKILDTFLVKSTLRGIQVSNDSKWIIVSDYTYGIMAFYWKDEENLLDQDKNRLNLFHFGKCSDVSPSRIILTQDARYILIQEYWDGFDIIDLKQIQEEYIKNKFNEVRNLTLIITHWWPNPDSSPNGRAMTLTIDENFVMLGERSVGIYIVNIKERDKPKLFQTIQAQFFSLSLALSQDINQVYLYYANGSSLLIFKKSEPNLNIDFPNTFNIQRSTNTVVGQSKWNWISAVDQKNEFLFVAGQSSGLIIMDLRQNIQLMKQISIISTIKSSYNVDNFILFGKDDQYVAVPIQSETSLMDIYNIADRSKPKLIQRIISDSPSYVYTMAMSTDQSLFIFENNQSILIFDSRKIGDFKPISKWEFPDGMFKVTVNGAIIREDSNYFITCERNNVVVAVNIIDKSQPQLASKYSTRGGESLIKGKYSEYKKYAFLIEGLLGIIVIDLDKLPQFIIISYIQIKGYVNHISLLQKNQFALVSTLDIGQITLIDFQDILNPKLISTFQYMSENAYSTSITPNDEYFFIVNKNGVRTVPLQSKVFIHTEIQAVLYSNTGFPELQPISKSQELLVGQEINFQFQIILPIYGMKITNIYYFQYLQIQTLPFWMSYNGFNQTLKLKIVKESLGQNFNSQIQNQKIQNIILVQTNMPLKIQNFIFNKEEHNVQTSIDQATMIWNYFHDVGIIDKSDFVADSFIFKNQINFQISGIPPSEELLNQVKLVLQNSVMMNPVQFFTISSLILHTDPKSQSHIKNKNYNLTYVDALESRVNFYLSINKIYGQFVTKSYNGLITSTSDIKDELKLEGDPDNLNIQLNNKIQIYIYNLYKEDQEDTDDNNRNEKLLSNILLTIKLTDGSNYEILQNNLLNEVTFLSYRNIIKKNAESDLQSQVNTQFPESKLEIKTSLSIEFSHNSFIINQGKDEEALPLKYSAYLVSGKDDYKDIPPTFWLQFYPSLMKFSGTAGYSDYNEKYCFYMNVTDSYSVSSDTFCIEMTEVPFIIVFNLMIQFLGPIVFILGLYKYKHIFYNYFFSYKNNYSCEYAKINHMFYHRTIFIGQNIQIANAILSQFLYEFNSNRQKFLENRQNALNKSNQDNKEGQINKPNQDKRDHNISIDNNQIHTPKSERYLNSQQHFDSNLSPLKMRNNFLVKLSQDQSFTKTHQKVVMDLKNASQNQRLSFLERTYLDPKNKKILFKKFLYDLIINNIVYKINGDDFTIADVKDEISEPSNLLRLSLRSLLARELLEKDKITNRVYQYMKQYVQLQKQYTKNDWYKYFVYIIHMEEDENDEQNQTYFQNSGRKSRVTSVLPKIGLKKDIIDSFINSLSIPNEQIANLSHLDINDINIVNKSQNTNEIFKKSLNQINVQGKFQVLINRNLIKEVLYADTFGLIYPPPSRFHPCKGESLHIHETQISSIQAFMKNNQKTFYNKIKKILKIEYVPIPSHLNRKLPQWIDYKSKQDLFLLKGCPSIEDSEEILIRFYDSNFYIVKHFLIKVTPQVSNILSSSKINMNTERRHSQIEVISNGDQSLQEGLPQLKMSSIHSLYRNSQNNLYKSQQKSNRSNLLYHLNNLIINRQQDDQIERDERDERNEREEREQRDERDERDDISSLSHSSKKIQDDMFEYPTKNKIPEDTTFNFTNNGNISVIQGVDSLNYIKKYSFKLGKINRSRSLEFDDI